MKHHQLIFVYGFAIFAMFFGSGNLVFPLKIGQLAGNSWMFGFLGLFITAILLPFLGLFVIKLHNGNYISFFAEGGKLATIILPLFTLSLLGSFGVVPRCITVAHGGINYLFSDFSLPLFSLLFSVLTYLICLKDHIMINVLGKWMSPILLISLGILIAVGIVHAPDTLPPVNTTTAFTQGFLTGYQTMDLFAAFFFSALIFRQIQAILPKTNDPLVIIKAALKPSIAGAAMLAVVYLGFVFMGAHYGDMIKTVDPELMLPTIATHILCSSAALIIGAAMVFSCLTTAVALNNIYARYIVDSLKLTPSVFPWVLLATTAAAFMISLLDFKGIAGFLSPILDVSYPGLIVLTALSIATKGHKPLKIWLFYSITLIMIVHKIFS
jgi:LIVCS family branched-chain amino acid:cation transporter